MKKVLVIIIIIAIIVAAVLVAAVIMMRGESDDSASTSSTTSTAPSPSETAPPTEPNQNTNQNTEEGEAVEYNGSGFTPSTLTIQQGDTVTFVNRSSTLVWPASDDHPVHDDLSGFDALEGLAQGEEYSFTFNEAGEWGYHNHLNSVQTGTIIVE